MTAAWYCERCCEPFETGDVIVGIGMDRSRASHYKCVYQVLNDEGRQLLARLISGDISTSAYREEK